MLYTFTHIYMICDEVCAYVCVVAGVDNDGSGVTAASHSHV